MSTTVIVSRIGRQLAIASWAAPVVVEMDALRGVLERHGLELLPNSLDGNEVIAAEGLSPKRAAHLAEDLRSLGLTVRVVNRTGLTESSRVGNALAVSLMGTILTLPFAVLGAFSGLFLGLVALLTVAGLFFVLNGLAIMWRGGASLPIAGAAREAGAQAAVERLAETLRGDVPEHVMRSILERLRALEAEARVDPDGPAAAALAALVADDLQGRQAETADQARALREEIRRARLAAAEVRGLK